MSDLDRYSRQVILREVGVHGQQLLRDSAAFVVGAGGLGSVAALYLVGAGIGRLLIADRDRVEPSNLHRQLLYAESDLGRPKAEAAAARLAAQNREVRVESLQGRLTPEALSRAVQAADVVLDCSDNFPTRFTVNRACVAQRKPLVSGAAIRLEGQIAVFDPRRADSPCYACLYPEEGAAQETCEEGGVLGPVVGAVGSLQVLAALKLLLGLGDDVGRLHQWDALSMRWKTVTVARDPRCPVCGARHGE